MSAATMTLALRIILMALGLALAYGIRQVAIQILRR